MAEAMPLLEASGKAFWIRYIIMKFSQLLLYQSSVLQIAKQCIILSKQIVDRGLA